VCDVSLLYSWRNLLFPNAKCLITTAQSKEFWQGCTTFWVIRFLDFVQLQVFLKKIIFRGA
jgi:hypothetical protein